MSRQNSKTRGTFLRSGKLAHLAGVSADTIRHYERKGLIPHPPRSPNGYRQYPPVIVDRIRVIRRALSIGFTIEELARVFQTRDRGEAPCHQVRDLAKTKLQEMEMRLAEIKTIRDELRSLLKDWDTRLAATKSGQKALLLESLPSSHQNPRLSPLSPLALTRKVRRGGPTMRPRARQRPAPTKFSK